MFKKTINYELGDTQILTFGSCLSRYVAIAFGKLFGGFPLCTVFNNRSDLFIKNILEHNDLSIELEQIKKIIQFNNDYDKFFLRQKRAFIGIYNPNNDKTAQKNIWRCINEQSINLIIIDNYMDIVAKDVYINDQLFSNAKFFLPKSQTLQQEKLKLNKYLSIEHSIECLSHIIKFLSHSFKKAKIVFINFPCVTYKENAELYSRFIEFNQQFKDRKIDLHIKPELFSKNLLTVDKQHFSQQFYYALAAQIYSITN